MCTSESSATVLCLQFPRTCAIKAMEETRAKLFFTEGLYHHSESTVAPHSQYKEAGLRIISHLSSSKVSTGVT